MQGLLYFGDIMKGLREKIAKVLCGSDYMFSAPGIRGVGFDEIVWIVDVIRKTNSKNINQLSEKIKYFYDHNENTIQFSKDWQEHRCGDYVEGLCDCFMPDVSSGNCYCLRKRREFLSTTDYRNTPEYKKWREGVFERDHYTCQNCYQKGGDLNAHHIKKFKDYPKLRYEKHNGITLCVPCHRKEHSNG